MRYVLVCILLIACSIIGIQTDVTAVSKCQIVSDKKVVYAPISQNAKDYLNKYLNQNKTGVADYYFSKELPKELMTEYKAFFKSDVLPYTYKMFPQTKSIRNIQHSYF